MQADEPGLVRHAEAAQALPPQRRMRRRQSEKGLPFLALPFLLDGVIGTILRHRDPIRQAYVDRVEPDALPERCETGDLAGIVDDGEVGTPIIEEAAVDDRLGGGARSITKGGIQPSSFILARRSSWKANSPIRETRKSGSTIRKP